MGRGIILTVLSLLAIELAVGFDARADGAIDNIPDKVRPMPPLPTKELAEADRTELEAGVAKLGAEIESLKAGLTDQRLVQLLPDVVIYHKAVRYPLAYHEEIDPKVARKALEDGFVRANELREGRPSWLNTSGPRGYVSKIDGSVQPYRIAIPPGYDSSITDAQAHPFRLDFDEHGRNEDLTELKFISQKSTGTPGKFLVNLYGRYCCANKFAGEIDLLECLDRVKQFYPIDENRMLNMGFSMGGAACWQFATHYTDMWAAASPGAGFSETRRFLHDFQNETVKPAWYEQKLWHWYDCTDYAENLFNTPTIAYAGELDSQKQASDVMAEAMEAEGLKLDRIIGPKTKHAYEKNAKIELDRRLDELLAKGRNPAPAKIRFTTWTLRYNRMFWVRVDAVERHWDRARVEAEVAGDAIKVTTKNVARMTIDFPKGKTPFKAGQKISLNVDGMDLGTSDAREEGTWGYVLVKGTTGWGGAKPDDDAMLRKRHGLQGPIDDAFMDSFIIVKPTGTPLNARVGAWADGECKHAIDHWRKQFRGEARVKNDVEVSDADIAGANLVLFGDPSSNKVMARVMASAITRRAEKIPIQWNKEQVEVGAEKFPADHHAVAMIYPNPLNSQRYVVFNSGFTFREYDYLNNARQVAKLPDYAVIDVNVPVSSRAPGGIATAGFFGERWELLADNGK